MQTDRTEILFGPFSSLMEIVPVDKAIFITSRALRQRAEALLASSNATHAAASLKDMPHAAQKESGLRWIEVPDGEPCKTFPVLESVYHALLNLDANRDTVLVAIGGGSVSDLAGFVAHTWMRGIRLVLAPTTLLAMIDASIGGKNAIDVGYAKNIVGSFHMPSHILCDVAWLRSLSPQDLASGMAEAIKHALLDSEDHVEFLERIAMSGKALPELEAGAFKELVQRSQQVKLRYVQADFLDAHARHVLNYGHTFGHAIELLTGLPHGFAVSAGMTAANRFAVQRGALSLAAAERIERLLARFGLPTSMQAAFNLADRPIDKKALFELMRADKKRRSDIVDFVMPHAIGDLRIEEVTLPQLEAALEWLTKSASEDSTTRSAL
jgi:3-dehydroquinate synthase